MYLIKDAHIVNEGRVFKASVLIKDDKIDSILMFCLYFEMRNLEFSDDDNYLINLFGKNEKVRREMETLKLELLKDEKISMPDITKKIKGKIIPLIDEMEITKN